MNLSINRLLTYYSKALALVLFSFLIACSENNKNSPLRVSLLPDTSKQQLDKRYKPLLNFVTEKTGILFQLVYSDSYADLYTRFINKEIDLAYFSGFTDINKNIIKKPGLIL